MTALFAGKRPGEIVISADSKTTWVPGDNLPPVRKIYEIEDKYFAQVGLADYRPTQFDSVAVARSAIRRGLTVQETAALLVGAFQPKLERALTHMLTNDPQQYEKFSRHGVVLAGLEDGLVALASIELKLAGDSNPVGLRAETLFHEDGGGYLWTPKEPNFTFDKDKETLLEAAVRTIESEIEKDSTHVDWPITAVRLTVHGPEWFEFQKPNAGDAK